MAKAAAARQWQRAVILLTGTVVAVVVIGLLYWAQMVFIPLALALYLAFLLNPLVRALQRRGLGRVPSVIAVVLAAALVLAGLGWLMVQQTSSLLNDLPNYTVNLRNKIKSLRKLTSEGGRLRSMMNELGGELKSGTGESADAGATIAAGTPSQSSVVVKPESPSWIGRFTGYVGSLIEILGSLALSLVLVIFMLFKREDLRNRFIRLVGHARISFTTKAVDEATQRISQYLIMQAAINGVFGSILALGLYLIGVKYPLLWGFLAAILRYLPYVGIWVAAAFPTILSLALFDSWWQPLAVVGLVLVLELIVTSFLEPWLFGQSMGVSEVGLLVTAAVMAFLWGPVGLLLAAPLTACLVVIGKYVPRLEFFDILLGDQPALDACASYYQRLLARDQDEAVELVLTYAQTESPEQVYDDILIPALTFAKRDQDRDELTDSDEENILRATHEILDDLGEHRQAGPGAVEAAGELPLGREPIPVFGCPSRDEFDELALEMLRQVLDPKIWRLDVVTADILAAELIARVAAEQPALICLASLPPGGLAHTRYLCKRLRTHFPEVRILVGRWGLRGNVEHNHTQLREAGANEMATTVLETRTQFHALLPVLVTDVPPAPDNGGGQADTSGQEPSGKLGVLAGK